MIRRRNLIWLVPFSLIATFPAWKGPIASFLTPRFTEEVAAQEDGRRQKFQMEEVTILQNKDSRITAEIRADRAFTTDTPNEYMLEEVDADLYNQSGEPTRITAREGLFAGDSQHLTLTDDVVIVKESDNQRLFTDLLLYDDKNQMVRCPEKTRIEGDRVTIDGTGLVHDMVQGTYELGGRVFCVIEGSLAP